jgi:hypothetical protein
MGGWGVKTHMGDWVVETQKGRWMIKIAAKKNQVEAFHFVKR